MKKRFFRFVPVFMLLCISMVICVSADSAVITMNKDTPTYSNFSSAQTQFPKVPANPNNMKYVMIVKGYQIADLSRPVVCVFAFYSSEPLWINYSPVTSTYFPYGTISVSSFMHSVGQQCFCYEITYDQSLSVKSSDWILKFTENYQNNVSTPTGEQTTVPLENSEPYNYQIVYTNYPIYDISKYNPTSDNPSGTPKDGSAPIQDTTDTGSSDISNIWSSFKLTDPSTWFTPLINAFNLIGQSITNAVKPVTALLSACVGWMPVEWQAIILFAIALSVVLLILGRR